MTNSFAIMPVAVLATAIAGSSLTMKSQWLVIVVGLFLLVANQETRAQSISGGFFSAKIDGVRILEFDQRGGAFPPDTVVTLAQDKAVQFTPLELPPTGGNAQTIASVIIGGGTVPIVDVEIEANLQTVPVSSSGVAEGSLNYNFAAFRRYLWASGTSIPVKVTMAAIARASEPSASATASAALGYYTPEGLLFIEVDARTQGTGGDEVYSEKVVTLGIAPDFSNTVTLSAGTLVFASPSQTGNFSAAAIADPRISIRTSAG